MHNSDELRRELHNHSVNMNRLYMTMFGFLKNKSMAMKEHNYKDAFYWFKRANDIKDTLNKNHREFISKF